MRITRSRVELGSQRMVGQRYILEILAPPEVRKSNEEPGATWPDWGTLASGPTIWLRLARTKWQLPFTPSMYGAIVRPMATSGLFCTKCGHMNEAQAAFCAKCGAPQPGTTAPSPTAAPPAATSPAMAYAGEYVPAVVPQPVGYAGFWIRFVAFVIDVVIIRVAMIPFALIFFGRFMFFGMFPRGGYMGPEEVLPLVAAGMKLVMLQVVAWWLYEALLTSSVKQATLGKMIFGLKVTDTQGQRISFARATGRHFGKYISGIIFLVGYIIAAFTARKQALHDMMADTLVLKTTA
jgi:uncharacterized RDD family membrane protein YckC